jgi:large subunit ribosomal protein L1
MSKQSKRAKFIQDKVVSEQVYTLSEAVNLLKEVKATKFDESVDVALRLGVDTRKAEQMVRGTCSMPNGLGKEVRVLVFAKGEKVQDGWLEFDRVVATPDMMAVVGRIGKILGPRGLMPNPKTGTVTFEVESVIKNIKAGQVEFRADKLGNLQASVGKISFDADKLCENISVLVDTVRRMKPSSSKGIYLRNFSLSSTMGPGIKVDPQTA